MPTWIALGNLFLNAVLDYVLGKWLGIWGIPLATAICNVAGAWALLVAAPRRIRRLDGARDRVDDDPVVVASAVVAAVAWSVWRPLDSALGRSFPAQVVSLGLGARRVDRRLPRRLPAAAGAGAGRAALAALALRGAP